MLMIILDETIVNVALASIQEDLGFSPSDLAWVVNAYLIAFGGLLLLAGRLGDLVGRRTVFVVGLLVFTAASALCALATSPGELVAARFLQGAGGALTSAVILGMIVALFPEPGKRSVAIGAFSFAAAAGGSIGLVAGGLIAQALSWHWIFVVNVPIGVLAVVLALRTIEGRPGLGLAAGADVPGALLATAGLMLGVSAIVGTAEHGWGSGRTLGSSALALGLVAGFVIRQRSVATPLLPLRLFRSRRLSAGIIVLALLIAGMFSFQFLTALYLQRVLGYEPAAVGLAIAPVAIGIGLLSLVVFPRLLARVGGRPLLLVGLGLLTVGLGLLTRLPVDGRYVEDVLPALTLLGVGFGLAMPALTSLTMADVPERDAGVASGLFNTGQQVSGALGLAAAASLAATRSGRAEAGGVATAPALLEGYTTAFTLATGLVAVALIVAAVLFSSGSAAPVGPSSTPEDPADDASRSQPSPVA
jgi:EmrB/QacA subfamily drug resistance transporter